MKSLSFLLVLCLIDVNSGFQTDRSTDNISPVLLLPPVKPPDDITNFIFVKVLPCSSQNATSQLKAPSTRFCCHGCAVLSGCEAVAYLKEESQCLLFEAQFKDGGCLQKFKYFNKNGTAGQIKNETLLCRHLLTYWQHEIFYLYLHKDKKTYTPLILTHRQYQSIFNGENAKDNTKDLRGNQILSFPNGELQFITGNRVKSRFRMRRSKRCLI